MNNTQTYSSRLPWKVFNKPEMSQNSPEKYKEQNIMATHMFNLKDTIC